MASSPSLLFTSLSSLEPQHSSLGKHVQLYRHKETSQLIAVKSIVCAQVCSLSSVSPGDAMNRSYQKHSLSFLLQKYSLERAFWNESQVSLRLSHPLIPQHLGCFLDLVDSSSSPSPSAGTVVSCYEFIQGKTLLDFVTESSVASLPIAAIRYYAMELVALLEYLHQRRVVHRDLNPKVFASGLCLFAKLF
jgi:serine/threonine protein kinase